MTTKKEISIKKPFEKERIEDLFISKGGYSDYAFRGILKEEEKEKWCENPKLYHCCPR